MMHSVDLERTGSSGRQGSVGVSGLLSEPHGR